ncbi:MAG: ABC transporter substrate-binding protein [Rhodocyclales bacterium RIFCSPLOWO2_02_FULL_63_24]|nr:MAG: ABC transporter substrate-binding protein [Rhodocyclales bacterium GWA2_65_19]OHC67974.1 MAG: ABC transporter substrate-binding protein [Rhodocyclales bacterium RIFCSPLOWO2_02_FULL_63_24]
MVLGFQIVPTAQAQDSSVLAKIRHSGVLKVALYKNFPPFSHDGQGADVELAEALAAKLGVKMAPLWFEADENMEDDLRNMVWKGHYLGYGPADVMMHAPVDREYMAKVDRVKFFAPYHRERYAVGRQLAKLPTLDGFEPLEKLPFAVEGDTLAATILLSADGGRYRNSLKSFRTADQAVAALKSGAVAATLAQQGELEGGLKGDARFAIDLPPHPVLQKRQWVVGLAVKAQSEDLVLALQTAVNELMADGTVKRIMQRHGVQHRQP